MTIICKNMNDNSVNCHYMNWWTVSGICNNCTKKYGKMTKVVARDCQGYFHVKYVPTSNLSDFLKERTLPAYFLPQKFAGHPTKTGKYYLKRGEYIETK